MSSTESRRGGVARRTAERLCTVRALIGDLVPKDAPTRVRLSYLYDLVSLIQEDLETLRQKSWVHPRSGSGEWEP